MLNMSTMFLTRHRKDLLLNVSLVEAIIRAGIGLGIPFLLIIAHGLWLIILVVAATTYLLVTAFLFFCPLKYFIQHQLLGKKRATTEEQEMPFKEL
jgi:DUF2892 family protein